MTEGTRTTKGTRTTEGTRVTEWHQDDERHRTDGDHRDDTGRPGPQKTETQEAELPEPASVPGAFSTLTEFLIASVIAVIGAPGRSSTAAQTGTSSSS